MIPTNALDLVFYFEVLMSGRRRGEGGRSAKIAERKKSEQIDPPRYLTRNIKCYDMLSEEELSKNR